MAVTGATATRWPQPTGLHTSGLVSKQAGNAVGQREAILDLPFTHSLPSRALPDGPIHQPQAFRSWLDVLQLPSCERPLGRPVDQAAARGRRSTGKQGASLKAEVWPRCVPGDQRAGRLPLLSKQRRASETRAQPSSTPLALNAKSWKEA
jgi:hypothetical protein